MISVTWYYLVDLSAGWKSCWKLKRMSHDQHLLSAEELWLCIKCVLTDCIGVRLFAVQHVTTVTTTKVNLNDGIYTP